jgi:hypothetical protein
MVVVVVQMLGLFAFRACRQLAFLYLELVWL